MTQPRTPREQLERAMHVSFKLPEQAAAMLDAYRDEVLAEAANIAEAGATCGADCDCAADPSTARGAAARIRAARTGQETPTPAATEPDEQVCGVCEDEMCGHCTGCDCEACDEARTGQEA